MSSLPKAGKPGDAAVFGTHASLSDIGRRGWGASSTGAGEAVAGARSCFDLAASISSLNSSFSENDYIPTRLQVC